MEQTTSSHMDTADNFAMELPPPRPRLPDEEAPTRPGPDRTTMESILSHPQTVIRTPDQRLRVFISSTLDELKAERLAAKKAVGNLHITPVLFELGARPHPPRDVYSAYLAQSHVFIGIYGDRYGYIVPGMDISGLEDEFRLSVDHPRLIYIKKPAPDREPRLKQLVDTIREAGISYKSFSEADELAELIENDLALLLTERFEHGGKTSAKVNASAGVPSATTPLIGREREVAAIKELLLRENVPLVTLTGTGGIGKTRLALEVAQQLKDAFRDGACFVPLAPVNDAGLVLPTIVQQVFPGELGGQVPLHLLTQFLKDQEMLLVLDNFEQVIGAAPSIAELSSACPRLRILITSREVLRVSGEHEFRVPMLSLPDLGDEIFPTRDREAQVALSSAVQLFVQRAQAIDRGFALTSANAATIAAICTRLDGLPLAIELAAARIRVLTPQAMLHHLGKSHSLLSSGRRDMPERHRTLLATIDWSYAMLLPEEQRLLCALSVFAGGCTLNAAYAVCGGEAITLGEWPRIAMYLSDPAITPAPLPDCSLAFLELIESLAAKNLIHCVERSGENRFLMYATIKDFAQQHLAQHPSAGAVARNHFTYCLSLAEQLWPALRGRDATSSYAQLDAELDNMREALVWARGHAPALGLRLVLALSEYWDTRGMPDEQIHWSKTFVRELASRSIEVPPAMMALARIEQARASFRTGDLGQCAALADEARDIAEHLGNDHLRVDSLMPRCMVAAYHADFEGIGAALQEGLAVSRRLKYEMATVEFLHSSAAAANFGGRPTEAIALCNESLELAKALGATRWEALSYSIRGFAHMGQGELEAAADSFGHALRCCQRFMDNVLVIYPLIGKAQVAIARGTTELAAKLLGAVERFSERKGTTIVPVVRQLVALTQEAARAQIGNEEYQRVHDIGRQLQLDEAMELVAG